MSASCRTGVFYPDYEFDVTMTANGWYDEAEDAIVLAVVTLRDRPEDATLNLLGPISSTESPRGWQSCCRHESQRSRAARIRKLTAARVTRRARDVVDSALLHRTPYARSGLHVPHGGRPRALLTRRANQSIMIVTEIVVTVSSARDQSSGSSSRSITCTARNFVQLQQQPDAVRTSKEARFARNLPQEPRDQQEGHDPLIAA